MSVVIPQNSRKAPIIVLESAVSTNDEIKRLARHGAAEGSVVVAKEQSGGRGRNGRLFQSPPEGLYLSMLLRPDMSAEQTLTFSANAAVAVRRAIMRSCALSPEIKWPNDLLVGGKKLCGILTELVTGRELIMVPGIGINVNTKTESFSVELRDTACSIFTETGRKTDIGALALAVCEELDSLYELWKNNRAIYLDEYRQFCGTIGKNLSVIRKGESFPALALDIDRDFSLVVETEKGIERIRYGEVSVR